METRSVVSSHMMEAVRIQSVLIRAISPNVTPSALKNILKIIYKCRKVLREVEWPELYK